VRCEWISGIVAVKNGSIFSNFISISRLSVTIYKLTMFKFYMLHMQFREVRPEWQALIFTFPTFASYFSVVEVVYLDNIVLQFRAARPELHDKNCISTTYQKVSCNN
jgi:hypothetical protein